MHMETLRASSSHDYLTMQQIKQAPISTMSMSINIIMLTTQEKIYISLEISMTLNKRHTTEIHQDTHYLNTKKILWLLSGSMS